MYYVDVDYKNSEPTFQCVCSNICTNICLRTCARVTHTHRAACQRCWHGCTKHTRIMLSLLSSHIHTVLRRPRSCTRPTSSTSTTLGLPRPCSKPSDQKYPRARWVSQTEAHATRPWISQTQAQAGACVFGMHFTPGLCIPDDIGTYMYLGEAHGHHAQAEAWSKAKLWLLHCPT